MATQYLINADGSISANTPPIVLDLEMKGEILLTRPTPPPRPGEGQEVYDTADPTKANGAYYQRWALRAVPVNVVSRRRSGDNAFWFDVQRPRNDDTGPPTAEEIGLDFQEGDTADVGTPDLLVRKWQVLMGAWDLVETDDTAAKVEANRAKLDSHEKQLAAAVSFLGSTAAELELTGTARTYTLPVTLRAGDEVEFCHRFNGSAGEFATFTVWAGAGETHRANVSDPALRVDVIFPNPLTDRVTIRQNGLTPGTTGRIMRARVKQ